MIININNYSFLNSILHLMSSGRFFEIITPKFFVAKVFIIIKQSDVVAETVFECVSKMIDINY